MHTKPAILKSAIEGWGVCGTTTTFGDPRRAWVNTILAASGAPARFPVSPLSHAISLFPLNRAGSVWRGKGNLMLHTEDGSAFEVGLASSQQNKHTELAPGDPGLGKSVLINTLSEIQISSAQKNLPSLPISIRDTVLRDWFSLFATVFLRKEKTKLSVLF